MTFLTRRAWLTSSESLNHCAPIPTSSAVNIPPNGNPVLLKARTERLQTRPDRSQNNGNTPGSYFSETSFPQPGHSAERPALNNKNLESCMIARKPIVAATANSGSVLYHNLSRSMTFQQQRSCRPAGAGQRKQNRHYRRRQCQW